MSDYKRKMGMRIKTVRKQLALTQDAVSEKLGISIKHFSEVERGLTGLSVENLIKLSSILGVSIDYIVKGEKDKERWSGVLASLEKVPQDKETLIKELIDLGISLTE